MVLLFREIGFEKFDIKFIKEILDTHSQISNYAYRFELGRLPMSERMIGV
jgi:hypothetical protein